MKSFTDLEQSKELAKILPIETADMGYNVFVDNSVRILPIDDWDLRKDYKYGVKFYPAWSLAALFKTLTSVTFDVDSRGWIKIFAMKDKHYVDSYERVELIDVVVDAVKALYEPESQQKQNIEDYIKELIKTCKEHENRIHNAKC